MKVIIVEGLDNTGKSTYIDKLKEHLLYSENLQDNDVMIFHFNPIIGRTNEESANLTDEYNIAAAKSILNCMRKDKHKYIILDRSWISEYVYGQIYRDRNSDDILQKIKDLNEYLTYYVGYNNVFLNMFLVKDPNFVIKNEDGDSLSIGNDQYEKVKTEIKLFNEVFDACDLQKSKVYVDTSTDNEFMTFNELKEKLSEII
jgi:hypothetical protein